MKIPAVMSTMARLQRTDSLRCPVGPPQSASSMSRYPRTPYWPSSPSTAAGDRMTERPDDFVGCGIVVTEKLDGACTALAGGEAWGRAGPSGGAAGPWAAMARKHHAWKIREPGTILWGEDVFAVHSIEYGAVREDRTFYAFSLWTGTAVASWDDTVRGAAAAGIPTVPVLWRGSVPSTRHLDRLLSGLLSEESALGGDLEGAVVRHECGFGVEEFGSRVCKAVRAGHVQSEQHWTDGWKACALDGLSEIGK